MNLCTICQGVCEDRKLGNEEVINFLDHKDPVVMLSTEGCAEIMHDSWQTFLVSLSQDCPICWSMWRIMRSSPLANPKEEDPDNFQTVICSAIYRLEHSYYSVQLGIVEKGDFLSYPCFDIWKTTEDCFLEEEKRNTIQKLHTPATVAQLANKWVVDCVNNHSRCHQRNIPSSTRPTRLLDIGNGGSSQWSIIETEGNIRMCERYVALSHRWAETMPKLLRKGGYRAQSSYEDRELPQHFQDIISICRAMAVRYLWIDSLCIFQDSAEDFQQEASIMADIYQNAFLTLSICWDYSSLSLFRDTSPQTIPRPPPADFLASRDKKFNKFSTLPAGHAFVEYTEGFEVDVADSLINGRGWVVQERFLSPRIVYLGNEQVYWECDVHIASEAVPQNLKDFGRRTDLDAGIGHLSWPSVMKAYSKCSLTRQEDKLIAISGLARSIAKRSGHSYFSGIWIEYWIQDLMWFPNTMTIRTADAIPENEMIELTDTLEAPSWLWLGCSKQILLGSIPRDPEFTSSNLCSFKGQNGFAMALLVDSKLKPPATSVEAFVSFAGASLDIICLPLLIDFNEKEMIEKISHLKLGASHFWQKDVKGEGAQISCLPLQFPNSAAQEKEISTEADKINFEFSQRYEPSVPCFLIPLYARAGNRGEGPGRFQEPIMQGLVVQQTSNGQFKRIACFDQGRHHNYGITSVVLNTISKQKLGAHGTSEMDREEAYKAAFLQYATTQTSLPMFADSTDDAKLSWSQVPQIKDLSWTKIELI